MMKLKRIKSKKEKNWKDAISVTNKFKFTFKWFEMIRSFDDSIFNGKITICKVGKKQSHLLNTMLEIKNKKKKKRCFWRYKCSL